MPGRLKAIDKEDTVYRAVFYLLLGGRRGPHRSWRATFVSNAPARGAAD